MLPTIIATAAAGIFFPHLCITLVLVCEYIHPSVLLVLYNDNLFQTLTSFYSTPASDAPADKPAEESPPAPEETKKEVTEEAPPAAAEPES